MTGALLCLASTRRGPCTHDQIKIAVSREILWKRQEPLLYRRDGLGEAANINHKDPVESRPQVCELILQTLPFQAAVL